ncbi:hypothetical protein LDG_6769 [Legionella drancourtii LLAP12]|uniref:Uncharacterized protein n=1 Tax=Legionella drancourtii LLAP12 TaxID=658187 RepID=G9ENE6_9GAMM|nr:hypothetical protein LDG_6769 [Legionella drancourtii LLAP12]
MADSLFLFIRCLFPKEKLSCELNTQNLLFIMNSSTKINFYDDKLPIYCL